MSDESDNDDALDEEWEASDGEPDLEKGNESQQGCFDTITAGTAERVGLGGL